jgi:hypothetical protein
VRKLEFELIGFGGVVGDDLVLVGSELERR